MSTKFRISDGSNSSVQEFSDSPTEVTFQDLEPGTTYTVTAELYAGDTVIDTDTKTFTTTIEYVTDKFYLQNETVEENVLTLKKTGTPTTTDLSYSLDDGTTWTTFDLTQATNTVTIPANGKVHLRSSTGFSSSSSDYLTITCSKNFSAHGNIQCLHNYKDLNDLTVDSSEFYKLFYGATTLISAKYLYLPATTISTYCYAHMFSGCSSLVSAPELPATTLADACYQAMFLGCTGLTTAPELPATTLAESCYESMFYSCTGLTTAPKLPATRLATSCYEQMFIGCYVLTVAPELPATTLANRCYFTMFAACISLTVAPDLPATILASGCYASMFQSCTSLTTAPELPATTLANECYNSMFYDCTSLTTAPELPVTTLANGCYRYMFQGCTALTTAPELPATTLANDCYIGMFSGCSDLQSVTTYVTNWITGVTRNWLYNAGTNATNPTVYCPADSTLKNYTNNNSGIPTGWTQMDI